MLALVAVIGFSCRSALPCLPLSRLRETNPAPFRARPRCRKEPLSSGTNLAAGPARRTHQPLRHSPMPCS
jgi:hypothetical protein